VVTATATNTTGSDTASVTYQVSNTRPAAPTITGGDAVPLELNTGNSFTLDRVLTSDFTTTSTGVSVSYAVSDDADETLISSSIVNSNTLRLGTASDTATWSGTQDIIVTATATNETGSATATRTYEVSNARVVVPAPVLTITSSTIDVELNSGNGYQDRVDLSGNVSVTPSQPTSTLSYAVTSTVNTALLTAVIAGRNITFTAAETATWSGTQDVVVRVTAETTGGTDTEDVTYRVSNTRPIPPTNNLAFPRSAGVIASPFIVGSTWRLQYFDQGTYRVYSFRNASQLTNTETEKSPEWYQIFADEDVPIVAANTRLNPNIESELYFFLPDGATLADYLPSGARIMITDSRGREARNVVYDPIAADTVTATSGEIVVLKGEETGLTGLRSGNWGASATLTILASGS